MHRSIFGKIHRKDSVTVLVMGVSLGGRFELQLGGRSESLEAVGLLHTLFNVVPLLTEL